MMFIAPTHSLASMIRTCAVVRVGHYSAFLAVTLRTHQALASNVAIAIMLYGLYGLAKNA
jgi:Ca2+/H+ antiporter